MSQEVRALLPSLAEMRRAIAQRDRAYDEAFVYGVITTGVFCLPSCAARPARASAQAASSSKPAWLRPCSRCPTTARRTPMRWES